MSFEPAHLREMISQILKEFSNKEEFERIIKRIDALEKKINMIDSKIEGLQFQIKEEILALSRDFKKNKKLLQK